MASLYESGDYGTPTSLARKLGGLIVFLEARFFGKSLPFGNQSFTPAADRIGLLSIEQTLADYQVAIQTIRQRYSAWHSPVVTFGGSLAGTLAALMRVRYPEVVDAAWASSAPLLGYVGTGVSQYAWRKQVTDNYEAFSPGCPQRVRAAFAVLQDALPAVVQAELATCESAYAGSWLDVQAAMWGALEGAGEFCYPPAKAPIPGYCSALARGGRATLAGVDTLLRNATPFYFSRRGNNGTCLNLTFVREQNAIESVGWNYLACSEIVHPIGANNVTDMFPPDLWSVAQTATWCEPQFGASTLRPRWIPSEFGMDDLESFAHANSRIVFTLGLRDPWHVQGIGLRSLSASLPVVTNPDGSHCADMAGATPDDTDSMRRARSRAEAIISRWIRQAQAERAPSGE